MPIPFPGSRCWRVVSALAMIGSLVQVHAADLRKHSQNAAAPAATPAVSRPGHGFSIEPAPAWVVPAKERAGVPVDKAPVSFRVVDEQTRVDDKSVVAYSHVVRVVNDHAGLGVAAQVEIVFEPSYQTLAFHHFDIVRDGKRLNRLDRKKIQLLQRETQLERRIYDGRVTASVVLDDVRVGDQVDFAYSIKGANPVFEGRFFENNWLVAQRGPAALYQYRVISPQSRKLHHRVGSPDIQVETQVDKGWRELVFRRESVPQMHFETNAPYTAALRHQVQISEFSEWAEVARWGVGLFANAGAPSEALDRKAADIKAASSEPRERLLAALRFVQSEVRYFGTEVGLNSHKPAPPEKVMAQRFGDCKDKVQLLMALLRRMDIHAVPVLVSSTLHLRVDAMQPSALDFDHVIARVQLDGKTYWLDPTRGHQTGTLDNRQVISFGKGLVLADDTTALASLPTPYDQERMSVRDVFKVSRFTEPVALEARVTYRGDLAELMREALATRNVAEIQSQLAAPYVRVYPKAQPEGTMQVEPSQTDDALTLVQRFTVPEFWRFPEEKLLVADLLHWSIIDVLRLPNEPSRRDDFALNHAGIYRHASVVQYPEPVFTSNTPQRTEENDRHFALRNVAGGDLSTSEYTTELRVLTDRVDAKDWVAYAGKIGKLGPRLGVTAVVPAVPTDRFEAVRRELQAAKEDMQKNKVKVSTRNQVDAYVRTVVLSAQLSGGRLAPNIKAQALRVRGVQYDMLGRTEEAARDFAEALALAPDTTETMNAAAVNALARRDYVGAGELAQRVLAKDAADAEARKTLAMAKYFSGDYDAARAGFQELLKDDSQVRRGYPLVWLSLAHRELAADVGRAAREVAEERLPSDWPRPLVDWARGKVSAEAVIESAKSGSSPAERLCEAYFYIGERYLAEGNTRRALEYYQKSIDQGVLEFIEDAAARARIATLKR